jgi:alginate O-acetyltransferase complex protein AlgJ
MILTFDKGPALTILGVVMIVAAPIVTLTTPNRFTSAGDDLNIIQGEWTLAKEKEFDENLSIRDVAVTTWSAIDYLLFRGGRPGVLIGSNDWLFTTEEFTFFPDAIEDEQRTLDIIKSVDARLTQQGIELVVAVVPDKSRVYPEQLGRYSRPPYVADRLTRFLAALDDAGIPAPRLEPALLDRKGTAGVFLHTDTHWTPLGADAAAARIAELALPLISDQPVQDFLTTEGEAIDHKGDLLNYIPMGVLAGWGPRHDTITPRTTTGTGSVGLFDAVVVPVALVGTSYSANSLWNFAGAVSEHLHADVANAAQEGKGPMTPMMDYLASADFAAAPPALVIWEIPERFIYVDYNITLPN